jgi:phosphatidylinositol alpha 1,6-mannosyltransferase
MSAIDPFARISRVFQGRADARRAWSPSCFVALGDSFTAGTGSEPGGCWADRLAAGIGTRSGELSYRNLAVDGATSTDVLEQARRAIELEPDLVTVICGANDVLKSTRPDPVGYASRLTSIFSRLRAAGPNVRIVTATAPDRLDFLPLRPRTRARVERGISRINMVTRRVADLHGIPYLEVDGHAGLADRENFADDGLHPSMLGHSRAAAAFAALMNERFGIEADLEERT